MSHTVGDKTSYNGGLFWHPHHYVDAGKSSHRSYPRAPGVYGGGPPNEQNYGTGLMLRDFLTRDPAYREAGNGLSGWGPAIDDGREKGVRGLPGGPARCAAAARSPPHS